MNFFKLFPKKNQEPTTYPRIVNNRQSIAERSLEADEEMYPIVLNQTNLVSQNNTRRNKYTYQLPNDLIVDDNNYIEIGLSNINIYNSFVINITRQTNIELQRFFDPAGQYFVFITYPVGFYTIQEIVARFYQGLIQQGWYLVDNYGNKIYFHQMYYNKINGRVSIQCLQIPNEVGGLPAGWQAPSGWNLSSYGNQCGSINFTSGAGFQTNLIADLFGFQSNIAYGYALNNFFLEGSRIAKSSDINSFIMSCNLNNSIGLKNPSNIIFSETINPDTFGELISYSEHEVVFTKVNTGIYNQIEIALYDNLYRELNILDTNIFITVILKSVKVNK